jgi:antitoxin component of RelBE/YafQ-DinJ toxin-antitoxin module
MMAKRTKIVMIHMVPEEKKAATELAEQLGVSMSDVIRLSLHETLNRINIPFTDIWRLPQTQPTGERTIILKK